MKTLYALVGAIAIGSMYFGMPTYATDSATNTSTTTETKKLEELLHVTNATFDKEVLKSKTPVVVDFYATWCPPCKRLAPIFAEASKQYAGKVKFVKLNTDEETISDTYQIKAIPTLVYFKDGKEVTRHVGFMEKESLVDFIDSSLKK